jgi:hypothetical protein
MLCSNQLSYVAKWRALFADTGNVSSVVLEIYACDQAVSPRCPSSPLKRLGTTHTATPFRHECIVPRSAMCRSISLKQRVQRCFCAVKSLGVIQFALATWPGGRQVTIKERFVDNLPPVCADRVLLAPVLIDVLRNAMDANRETRTALNQPVEPCSFLISGPVLASKSNIDGDPPDCYSGTLHGHKRWQGSR